MEEALGGLPCDWRCAGGGRRRLGSPCGAFALGVDGCAVHSGSRGDAEHGKWCFECSHKAQIGGVEFSAFTSVLSDESHMKAKLFPNICIVLV